MQYIFNFKVSSALKSWTDLTLNILLYTSSANLSLICSIFHPLPPKKWHSSFQLQWIICSSCVTSRQLWLVFNWIDKDTKCVTGLISSRSQAAGTKEPNGSVCLCSVWLTEQQSVSHWANLYKTPEAWEHSEIIRLSLHIMSRLREYERLCLFVCVGERGG